MNTRRGSRSGWIVVVCILIIAGLLIYMFWANTKTLKRKEQEAITKEEQLQKQIEEQDARTEELNERKKYVHTDEYIIEVARDKLGLIMPEEILFKEKEGD